MKAAIKVLFTLLLFCEGGQAQGFINLNFESARIVPIPDGEYGAYSIATTNALPGWTVYYGSSQQSQITYNDPAIGSTFVTLYATNGQQLSGNYSVLLQGGQSASAASISQTGLVPSSAESLLFEGQQTGVGTLQVSLGSQDLSLFAISNALNYTLYGVDISTFAGQTEQLMFSALENPTGYNNWNIDNIQFSSSPIPEPSAIGLSALGGLLLAWRHRRKISRI